MKTFDLSTLNLPSGTSYPITVKAIYGSEASLDSEQSDPVYYYPTGSVVDLKVECSIDFDDEWIQEGCHWNYKRFFDLTWKIWSGPLTNISTGENVSGRGYSDRYFYYSLSGDTDTSILSSNCSKSVINDAPWVEGFTRKLEIFKYRLYVSNIPTERLVTAAKKGFNITAKVNVKDYNDQTISSSCKYECSDFELPPKLINNIVIDRKSADHIICSWEKAEPTVESSVDVAGYAIELFGKKKDDNTFKQISDLAITKVDGKYKLVRATNNLTNYTFADANDIEEDDNITFIGCGDTLEAFIDDPDTTEVYFSPRDFEITPGHYLDKDDDFQIVVYPYIVYSCYLDLNDRPCVQHGALLTNNGTSSEKVKFKLGVVRVKTEGGWVEGQVWVMTADGWKEADSVYAMVDDGTGKGVWKEAT